MEMEHTTENEILIITPDMINLEAKEAPHFKQEVIDLITSNNKYQVVIDLHNLQVIDTSGLGSILAVLRFLATQSGELKLSRVNKPVQTTFELVSMHRIFKIFNSTEEAVTSFKES